MATVEQIAPKIIDFIVISSGDSIAVASTGTVYSNSAPLPREASFGVELKFSSEGAVDVKVEVEQSNQRPTTEEAADATKYAVPEDTAGSSVGLVATITDELPHFVNFSPMVSGFIRLKLTGQGSNAATTKLVSAKLVYVKGQ